MQALHREFEILCMKEGEIVEEYFTRTLTIANKMRAHGEKMDQNVIIEKILRSMTVKFNYVVVPLKNPMMSAPCPLMNSKAAYWFKNKE